MKFLLSLLLCLSISHLTQAQQLSEKNVPAAVKTVATAKNGGQVPNMWVLDKNRGYYVATYVKKEPPIWRNILVGLDGKWQKTSELIASADKLPAAVAKALQNDFLSKGYKASNMEYTLTAAQGNYYRLDLSSEDENLDVRYDATGKLLKKEVR